MAQAAKTEALASPSLPHSIPFEEFLEWGEEGKHAEWVDGAIVEMTSPSSRHQKLSLFLTALLQLFVQAHQSGEIFCAPFLMRLMTRPSGREPDILFVAIENLSRIKANYLDGPADLVIEIVSPESAGRDRGDKFYEYEQSGVREYWLLDPERKQPEFYQRGEDGIFRPVMPDAEGIYQSSVLHGLWLRVAWLWQEPLPPLLDVVKQWGIV